jgi:hypothetical protein
LLGPYCFPDVFTLLKGVAQVNEVPVPFRWQKFDLGLTSFWVSDTGIDNATAYLLLSADACIIVG